MKPLEEIFEPNDTALEIVENEAPSLFELPDAQPDSIFKQLSERKIPVDQFLDQIGAWWHYLDAEERGLEAKYRPLIDRMLAEIKGCKQKREFIEKVVSVLIPPGPSAEWVGDKARFIYTPKDAVDVIDAEKVPLNYCRIYEPEPKKPEILKALKAGEPVPGCALKTNLNLQVKPGGKSALARATARQKKIAKAKEEGVEMIEGGEGV